MSATAVAPAPQLDLAFAPDGSGVTRLSRRRVRYPYAFLKPFWFGDRPSGIATVMLQSASGGLFGGERLGQTLRLAAGARVHLTTQAAAIVHAAREHPAATQDVEVALESGAYLEYLPEPLVLFPGARLAQRLAVTMDPAACLVLGDGCVRHDPGSGDAPFASFRSDIEVALADGRPLFADRTDVAGADFDRALASPAGPWRACGIVAIAAPSRVRLHATIAAALDTALAPLGDGAEHGMHAGTGALPNDAGVVCRIVARDGAGLRAALEACWRSARKALTGAAAPRRRK